MCIIDIMGHSNVINHMCIWMCIYIIYIYIYIKINLYKPIYNI